MSLQVLGLSSCSLVTEDVALLGLYLWLPKLSWQSEPSVPAQQAQGREVEKAARPGTKPSAQQLLRRDLVKTNQGNFKTEKTVESVS